VGNIFKLGTKYSEYFDVTYLDESGVARLVWMGSYGIGVDAFWPALRRSITMIAVLYGRAPQRPLTSISCTSKERPRRLERWQSHTPSPRTIPR